MPDESTELAELLDNERDRIVARFIAQVERKDLSPAGVSRSLLVDHIPSFLDEIIAEIRRLKGVRASHDALDTSPTARRHGEQRWELGYELDGLIREYGILRHCILEMAKERRAHVSIDEFDVLAKCLSVGVTEASTEYVKYLHGQLNAEKARLGFLAEAGQLLSSSLDYRSTLHRMTSLVVPRFADCCAIHLESSGEHDMPIAHVDPAKTNAVREVFREHPLPKDADFGYPAVIRTGRAQFVPRPEREAGKHRAFLERLGVSSAIIAPLRVDEHIFGAVSLMYTESGRKHTEQDSLLATELANRAAVAIDNARLYDLSQQARSRVEAATRAKDEFVAMVSHELRSPLNAILGWARLMRTGNLDEAKERHALEVVERNAEAQNRLIADLLDISRMITGKFTTNPSQVNLCDVIEMALEVVRPAADAKGIRVDVDLDRDAPVFRGDADRLQQVVWNLLVNAVKFTPKNGNVRVRLLRLDSDLELVIEDDGVGIDPSFLPSIFESFRQSDASKSRRHGGLGIGLSIAKHIVELHGGSIEAASRGSGLGSTFSVRLPVSPLVSTALGVGRLPNLPATKPKPLGEVVPSGVKGVRALVVDDEPDAREVVAFVLRSAGIDVRLASNAAEAIEALERYEPHVIISDVGMPDEDGYSFIRHVRTLASPEMRRIPAIALTAYAYNEDRTRALVEGFNMHMAKPVEPTALVQAVVELATDMRR